MSDVSILMHHTLPSQMTANIHLKQQEQEVLQQMVGSRRAQGLVLRMWISILGGLNC